MRIYVNEMPKKKEACLFYRKTMERHNGRFIDVFNDVCSINNKKCSFKNEDSILGGECRCLKVVLSR